MQVILQLAPPDVPSWVRIVSQLLGFGAAILGLAIAYQAYRGYRRNDSRPMLFIAIGFVLTVGLPFVLLVPYVLLPEVTAAVSAIMILSNLSSLVGLFCILYALRMPA